MRVHHGGGDSDSNSCDDTPYYKHSTVLTSESALSIDLGIPKLAILELTCDAA